MTIVISKDQIVNSDPEKFIVKNEAYNLLKDLMCSNTKEEYKGNEFGYLICSSKSLKKTGT